MHQNRHRLALSRSRRWPGVEQVKRVGTANDARLHSAQREECMRVLLHSLPPTVFLFVLEAVAQTHQQGIAHDPAPLPNLDLVPTSRCRQKQKRLTLPTVSRRNQIWLLAVSIALSESELEQPEADFNRYRRPYRFSVRPARRLAAPCPHGL